MFRLAAVDLHYHLQIPGGKRAEADRALEVHERYCPLHQSIQQGFPVRWSVEVKEGS